MKSSEDKKITQNEEDKSKSKLKLIAYVVVVAGFIFTAWIFILPYSLSTLKKEGGEKNGFLNGDTQQILQELKEIFKIFGSKIEDAKNSTQEKEDNNIAPNNENNFEENSTSTQDEAINEMKEKLIESTEE